jgi:hypothetical protein
MTMQTFSAAGSAGPGSEIGALVGLASRSLLAVQSVCFGERIALLLRPRSVVGNGYRGFESADVGRDRSIEGPRRVMRRKSLCPLVRDIAAADCGTGRAAPTRGRAHVA